MEGLGHAKSDQVICHPKYLMAKLSANDIFGLCNELQLATENCPIHDANNEYFNEYPTPDNDPTLTCANAACQAVGTYLFSLMCIHLFFINRYNKFVEMTGTALLLFPDSALQYTANQPE